MKKYIIIIGAVLLGLGWGYAMAPSTEIKTVEKKVIVSPDFKFETGNKVFCDLGTGIKPCEVVGKKSNGSYAIKYTHTGIAGGEKIITIDASDMLR